MKTMNKILIAAAVLALNGPIFAADSPFGELSYSGAKAVGVSAPAETGLAEARRLVSEEVPAQGFNATQRQTMLQHNSAKGAAKGLTFGDEERVQRVYRPYADYEHPGYLIMSSDFNFNSREAKLAAAAALPASSKLVIFTSSADRDTKEAILRAYEGVIARNRVIVIQLPSASRGFWARDGIPVPVMDSQNRLVVVDAVYGHGFEPDAEIARLYGVRRERHDYYYEGGNFMANRNGLCIMVNHGYHTSIPDNTFVGQYGCDRMLRLPFVDGIGHIDEHVRYINDTTVVTDIASYKPLLERAGLTVHMMPKPTGAYETHVNSLILGNKVIMPAYGGATDEAAMAVYRGLGLEPVAAPSNSLSNRGQGSVHCITMTYPAVPAPELMKALGASEI